MTRVARTALCAAALLLARDAAAQTLEASAMTYSVQSHIRFSSTRLEQTGQWVGGEAELRLGALRVGLLSAMGSLNGTGDALHPDSKARVTNVTVHSIAAPWLSIGGVMEAKAFVTDAGTTVWRLIGGNIRATPSLDSRSLEGLLDFSYWPMASVIGGEKMPLALRAVVGATYRFGTSPLGVRFAYRFERFDFAEQGSTPARLEQFRGATLGAVLRFSR
jgi:hypothetical protein